VLRSVDRTVSAVFIVSPNNPTGSAITIDELRAVRAAAPGAPLILDLAYAEFADEDLTRVAVRQPRTVVTRTLSKAWGLAGLRVGYAIGEPEVIGWLRRAGNPYAVSALSLAVAERVLAYLEPEMLTSVACVRSERARLASFLGARRIEALPSQANFVLARFRTAARAGSVFQMLLARKILVRAFPDRSGIGDSLRTTCPVDERDFTRLLEALAAAIDETGDSQ
jgi:histidinol-phosphate aminotransferase